MPEIWLAIGMCVVILVPFIKRTSMGLPAVAALVTLFLALGTTVMTVGGAGRFILGADPAHQAHGMLAIDLFSQFFKALLFIFTILVIAQWWVSTRHETAAGDTPDFLCLLLGAALGMSLMASANNLLK